VTKKIMEETFIILPGGREFLVRDKKIIYLIGSM